MLKKKLQDEIGKHQAILQRYQKIRDRLKYEVPSPAKEADEEHSAPAPAKGLRDKAASNPQMYKN
jgi:hypothetical protein